MRKTENILINISIALNALLLMLLIFENRIAIPAWLQVAGRFHPLVLHFPIAMVVMVAIFSLYSSLKPGGNRSSVKIWVVLSAAMGAGTALSGFLLSKESGFDTEAIGSHKWSGTILSGILLLWSLGFEWLEQKRTFKGTIALSSLIAVFFAGDLGANITHGENFLWEPVTSEEKKPAVLLEDALVFAHMVRPILETKCMGCHNEKKAKGELVMSTEELLLKGGKTGKPWDLKEPGFGLMMKRIHLSLEEEEHMPPRGKPQLTEAEIFLVEQWLAKGASFTLKAADLQPADSLFKLATNLFSNLAAESYNFEAADASTLHKLNTSNRSVYQLAMDVPAIGVDFFGRSQYQPEQLKELLKVKEQIVSLNLNKMPVKDEEMATIAQFKNLRRLNLSFTDITNKGLSTLLPLTQLQQLSLSGTAVSFNDFSTLRQFEKLTALYAWSTKVKPSEQKKAEQVLGKTFIHWGFYGDTITLQLNPPVIENEAQIIAGPTEIKMKHFLAGVNIHYTLDGSEPDSMLSPVFKPGLIISNQVLLKAKAFKKGWISSNGAELQFFKNKYKPDSVWALLPADEAYKGNGPATLNDNIKGDQNFRSGKWLGYRFNAMDMVLRFNKPTPVSSITLSCLVDIASYIMPPQSVEIWGGHSMTNMKLLQKIEPGQPEKEAPVYTRGFECKFPSEEVQYIRILAKPVGKLPAWHRGKGDKGWIFNDEIFVN